MPSKIIMGAGGHSKEVLDILFRKNPKATISFFNNTVTKSYKIFDRFDAFCRNEDLHAFDTFYLGIGDIRIRKQLSNIAIAQGLTWKGVRSDKSSFGNFDINIDETVDIMDNVFISSSVKIGRGTLLNRNVNIHHNVTIGDFCEIAPSVQILGNVQIGNNVFIGAGAVILPKIIIEDNVIVGAGAVVTKNVNINTKVAGVPAITLNT